jgi:lipopolysaccharide export system protein LptA
MKFSLSAPLLASVLVFALAFHAGAALAEKADRNKPMNIESDTLRYDDLRQVSVFTGRVVMTKGTIVIRGHQVEVRQDPEGYQYGLVTSGPDAPAFFRQKREGLEEFIEGDGETIEYDGKADIVKFIKKAQMRRIRGTTLGDEVNGALIVYENLTDMFSVDGSAGKPVSGAPGGRVRAMLVPKPAAETSPAPTGAAVVPALRSSPALEGPAR